ncbi:MAG: hypothetical protein AVDCRST_MAG10-2171, partial [uncultured Acidimicrobiales bacterium]
WGSYRPHAPRNQARRARRAAPVGCRPAPSFPTGPHPLVVFG